MYWPDDEEYYPGVVAFICTRSGRSLVRYNDGQKEILDLSKERFRIISSVSSDAESVCDESNITESAGSGYTSMSDHPYFSDIS